VNPVPPTLVSEVPTPLWLGPRPDRVGLAPPVVISLCRTPVAYAQQVTLLLEDHPGGLPERAIFEAFLERAHALASTGPSYWHCDRGMNRGGFAVAGYLARYRGWPIAPTIHRLRELRSPQVLENPRFRGALLAWYG
jgi:hypothetical protein